MSDTGRKDLSTQAKETVTPNSQKSYLDQATETVTDAGDRVAAAVQPGDSKSTTQKLSDTGRSGADDAQNTGQTYAEQAQKVVGDFANTASETLSNISKSLTGEKK